MDLCQITEEAGQKFKKTIIDNQQEYVNRYLYSIIDYYK